MTQTAMQYHPGVLVDNIEKITNEQWKQLRKKGIGGSDAAKILGVSPFCTRKELFWDKCGIPHQNKVEEENELAKEIGHRLESLVIQLFLKRHPGWKVYFDRRMFYHPVYPWMLANLDGLVVNPHTGDLYILEVKTTSVHALDKWGKKNSNVVPVEYEAQGRHYMAVTGINGVIYICLAGNQEDGYRERWILRDKNREEALIQAEKEFWTEYMQKRIEPPYNNQESAKKVLSALQKHYRPSKETEHIPESLRSNIEYVLAMNKQIASKKKEIQKLENMRDKALTPVLDFLKGKEGVMSGKESRYCVVFQKREQNSIKSEDLHSLALEFPDVYERFVTHSESGFWKVKETSL